MKQLFIMAMTLTFVLSCTENIVDSRQQRTEEEPKKLRDYIMLSKANGGIMQTDSLKMLSTAQSDLNTMMMNQICSKDSCFILAISRADALSIGVSDELYEHYVGYVAKLNEQLEEIK